MNAHMTISDASLKQLIISRELISKEDLINASHVAAHLGCAVSDVLIGRDLLKDSDLLSILSEYYHTEEIDLGKIEIEGDVLKLIPEDFAQKNNVVVFAQTDNVLHVALEDPQNLELIELIKKTVGTMYRVKPYVATANSLKNSLKLYKTRMNKDEDELAIAITDNSAVVILEKLLEEGVREGASDIHFEPMEDRLLVRFRVDGVLHDEKAFALAMHPQIVARIKILSDLKLDETRLPQDGQFSISTDRGDTISFRVSVIPSVNGEKIVLRILESALTRFNLEELGLLPEDQEIVSRVLERTHGMLLVTGPTGSGKTTTLYTVLGLLNKSDVNIITIEDPVENKIKRINQIQVNTAINLTFASGLRSVLRQDPDIIMVGEIRDHETSVIATNAAMTGHMVFSTVHANTAAGAIPRMIDLGTEPFLIASTLNMVIAQRLVRVLCPKCKKETVIDAVAKEKLTAMKDTIQPDIYKRIGNAYAPVGCNVCHGTGYRGRIGIFEILYVDEEMKELIAAKAATSQLWNLARKKGAKTMLEDGIIKAAKGMTTIEEVLRVISE